MPPEALPSELAAFLNIPLETTDTKLEMAMDMRTGMCKGNKRRHGIFYNAKFACTVQLLRHMVKTVIYLIFGLFLQG